ncbi:S41 family peptidase [uncultured Muriicola sp.]|uniref:S41 family peptidase n=1 Tax=uncultured Muriicola sp. TaxID=1583102 RepID=UPI0026126257|nr:S41 family peptidase [uncultured Muriicola sp.]
MKKRLLIMLVAAFVGLSCSKDDDVNQGGLNPNPTANLDIQDFMWKSLNLWYFWQAEVPNLADDRFSTNAEYTEFLQSEANPTAFLENQLLFSEDRFTFYSDDYEEFTNSLTGVTKSNGLSFGLIAYGTNEIAGYVRYVTPNSDADGEDITRGEFFSGVDGIELTESNYIDLLFGENDTYTLNMANYENDTFVANGKDVELTKQENFQENPIYVSNMIETNGQKIGYIFYRRFLTDYNDELNNTIGALKSQGITDLVLDLRYNPGGFVSSAVQLSSMIYGTNTDDLFYRRRYNPKLQEVFGSSAEDNFVDQTTSGMSINTLNLNRVYILTTNRSASASELVINCLDPYMEVIQVGTTTTGKNEFSVTLVDDPDRDGLPYVYTAARESFINPDNSWAIQAIIGRGENSAGFSDYTDGLVPEIELAEDVLNLGILGDLNEPLLARAIEDITGVSGKRDFGVRMPAKPIADSDSFSRNQDLMIMDNLKPISKNDE